MDFHKKKPHTKKNGLKYRETRGNGVLPCVGPGWETVCGVLTAVVYPRGRMMKTEPGVRRVMAEQCRRVPGDSPSHNRSRPGETVVRQVTTHLYPAATIHLSG